jgi:hypothetical protein
VLLNEIEILDVPEDFQPFVAKYVNHCRSLITSGSVELIERSVPLFYRPHESGTVDFTTITDKGIHIRDLKYGKGVFVDSQQNKQLACYGQSIIEDLKDLGMFDFPLDLPVTLEIIMPRHHEWVDEPWVTTVGELEDFCRVEILPAVRRIEAKDFTYVPSEKGCRFCPICRTCSARGVWLESLPSEMNPMEFDDLDAPALGTLTDEQRLSIFRNAKDIKSFLDDVIEGMEVDAANGNPVAGTKLVAGRQGNRAWIDEDKANRVLLKAGLMEFDDRYKTVLRSPVDVEERLGPDRKGVIDELVTRSPGKPTLALEGDKRSALTSACDDFTNLDEREE